MAKGEVILGIRPEHFGPQHGQGLRGQVVFVEPQGREALIDVVLDGGGAIRSILPAGEPVVAGQRVDWGIARDSILAFAQNGDRL